MCALSWIELGATTRITYHLEVIEQEVTKLGGKPVLLFGNALVTP
jgi:hypothetical protein